MSLEKKVTPESIYFGYEKVESFLPLIWSREEGLNKEKELKESQWFLRQSQQPGFLTLVINHGHKNERYLLSLQKSKTGIHFKNIKHDEKHIADAKKTQVPEAEFSKMEENPKLIHKLTKSLLAYIVRINKLPNIDGLMKHALKPTDNQPTLGLYVKIDGKNTVFALPSENEVEEQSIFESKNNNTQQNKDELLNTELTVFEPTITLNITDLTIKDEDEAIAVLDDLNLLNNNHIIMRTPLKVCEDDGSLIVIDAADDQGELKEHEAQSQKAQDTFYKLISSHEILATMYLTHYEETIKQEAGTIKQKKESNEGDSTEKFKQTKENPIIKELNFITMLREKLNNGFKEADVETVTISRPGLR